MRTIAPPTRNKQALDHLRIEPLEHIIKNQVQRAMSRSAT
jgi:hypothetical protein